MVARNSRGEQVVAEFRTVVVAHEHYRYLVDSLAHFNVKQVHVFGGVHVGLVALGEQFAV